MSTERAGMPNAPAAASALDVLEHLSRHAEPVPAASIARDLTLPRSSVYHLLKVLCSRGYVTHYAEERRYGLGSAAYELGSAYQRQAPLARVARAAIRRLADQCGRNAHFATLDGQRKQAQTAKEELVKEAESLSESSEWAPTANRLKELMAEWKARA